MTDNVSSPGASLGLVSVPNLRDLGGWSATEGRVRRGVLYRSTELHELVGPDVAALEALGLRTIYDLRTEAERVDRPDRVPGGVGEVGLDVLADLAGTAGADAAQLPTLLADPTRMSAMLADADPTSLLTGTYRDLVRLPSALRSYRSMFAELADDGVTPALFHCTTGKDRTGWAAAVLLLLLGVSEVDVRREYLLTNEQLLPSLQPLLDRFAAGGGDPTMLEPLLGVRSEYLDAALSEMLHLFGDVPGYFSDGLGLDASMQRRLQTTLLEPLE